MSKNVQARIHECVSWLSQSVPCTQSGLLLLVLLLLLTQITSFQTAAHIQARRVSSHAESREVGASHPLSSCYALLSSRSNWLPATPTSLPNARCPSRREHQGASRLHLRRPCGPWRLLPSVLKRCSTGGAARSSLCWAAAAVIRERRTSDVRMNHTF